MDVSGGSGGGRRGGTTLKKDRELSYKTKGNKISTRTDLCIGNLTIEKPPKDPNQKPSNLNEALPIKKQVCYLRIHKDDTFSLKILRQVYHPNVLHMEGFIRKGQCIEICVEEYTESLEYFVNDRKFISYPAGAPSKMIQALVRQIIEGIDALRVHGFYHGNLNLKNTFFDRPTMLVKLANFKLQGDDMNKYQYQFDDWRYGLGGVVKQISTLRFQYALTQDHLIDAFVDFCSNLPADIPVAEIKHLVLDHVFLWEKKRKTDFFVYEIIPFLHDSDFIAALDKLSFIPEKWNQLSYYGLLIAMNNYRCQFTNKGLYPEGKHSYVLFVSGAYTHEEEMRENGEIHELLEVDTVINSVTPDLCLELVRIVNDLKKRRG